MYHKNIGHFQGLRHYICGGNGVLFTVVTLAGLFVIAFTVSVLSGHMTKASPQMGNISTGQDTTCVAVDGWAKCWGANQYGQLGNGSTAASYSPVEVTRSGSMSKKNVDKVAVGISHTCAIADARAYCWGSNSRGQLGNGSTTSSSVPIAVAANGSSALANKEVIDIASGANFSCALSSDGIVACWGEGTNGRLGLGNTNDSSTPKAVSLGGKRAVALARPSGAAMCALVAESSVGVTSMAGNPYCWGQGMDNSSVTTTTPTSTRGTSGGSRGGVITAPEPCEQTPLRGGGLSTFCVTKIVRDGTQTCREGYTIPVSSTVYLDALSPKLYSGSSQQRFFMVDTHFYATAIGMDQKVYYWGGNGNKVTSWSTVTCQYDSGGKSGVSPTTGNLCKGGSGEPGCGSRAQLIPVTTNHSIKEPIGQKSPTGPLYAGMSVISTSGSGFDGLFCVSLAVSSIKCDANGTRMAEGQTGSGYTQTCTSSGCQPDPVGLQPVFANGWLSGRLAIQLATGTSGHTCALAANTVACWGVNTSGQLGTGNTQNKNVPTLVSL